MYKLIGSGQSRTFRVMWLLEELGQDYDWLPERPHSEIVRQHSILGKLPVLLVDDVPLTDSSAIMAYLADKHGRFTNAPDTLERARQDGLTHQILDDIEGPIWTAARHTFVLPEDMRVPEVKPSLKKEYARNIGKLGQRMQGEYLMGDEPTIPDFLITHCMNWAQASKFPDPPENLAELGQRMRGRPAYKRTAEKAKG